MHERTFEDLAYHELGHAFMNLHHSIPIGEVFILGLTQLSGLT